MTQNPENSPAADAVHAPSADASHAAAPPSASAPAESASAPDDDGPEGPEGPEGPGGESADPKKRRKRRKKKPGGAAEGPEGPPVEHAEGHAPSAPRERPHGKGGHGGGGGGPVRERAFGIGEEVFGKVTAVLDEAVMIDLAGKALAIFDRSELADDDLVPSVGDRFVAQVHGDGTRGGLVVVTRKPLREEEFKPHVEEAFKNKTLVPGLVTGAIKGGIEVDVGGVRAFAPASHVDLRMGADLNHLIGQRLTFYVEAYGKRGRDVVLSRKALLEEEYKKHRESSLGKLSAGQNVKGVVRSVLAWGAFVAIPEADEVEGLLHVSELSHDPRARPQDILKIGAEIDVQVVKIDERGKLWLSKKSLEADPWSELKSKYAPGTRHMGKVTRIQPFGAFVELEAGLDGLLHIMDMSIKRIDRPQDVVKEGQEIDVVVASIDGGTKKIALHPAPPDGEGVLEKQKIGPGKIIKVAIVGTEPAGVLVRILGTTGRNARGFIPAGQTGTARGTDLRKVFPVGSKIDVKVVAMDPKRGEPKLSVRAVAEDTEKAAYNEYRSAVAKEAKFGTFGDLLKKLQK